MHRAFRDRAMRTRRGAVAFAIAMVGVVAACTSTTQTLPTAPIIDKCQVSASNAPTSFDALGGLGTVTITTTRDCTWSVATTASWVTIDAVNTGQGTGSVGYHVASNPAPAARSTSISIGSDSVPLSQAGAPCRFSISRNVDSVGSGGGRLSIDVTTLTGCNWTASSAVGWITIPAGASGTASGTVSMSVAANAGIARTGEVVIAGQNYSVNQAAAPSPPTPPPPPPAPTPPPAQHVNFTGTVSSVGGHCPSLSLNVGGRSVITDGSTKFKHLKCDDVKSGMSVRIGGIANANGIVLADEVDQTK